MIKVEDLNRDILNKCKIDEEILKNCKVDVLESSGELTTTLGKAKVVVNKSCITCEVHS